MEQASVPEVESLIRLPLVPFFWFVMHITAVVAAYRSCRGAVLGMMFLSVP
jgi:hypothetical protein